MLRLSFYSHSLNVENVATSCLCSCFRWKFGDVSTFIAQTGGEVRHIEFDRFEPENILITAGCSLKQIDVNSQVKTLAGVDQKCYHRNGKGTAAYFKRIYSFSQADGKVLVVDTESHCLRSFDRSTAIVKDVVGNCSGSSAGFMDGIGASAKFNSPTSIIQHKTDPAMFLIADRYNDAIRQLDSLNRNVTTVLRQGPLQNPVSLSWNPYNDDEIFILQSRSFYSLSLTSFTVTHKFSGLQGSGDGSIIDATYLTLTQSISLHQQLYLVSDSGSNKIRVVNMKNQTVTSICNGQQGNSDGPAENCSLYSPYSIALLGNHLYIGTHRQIRYVRGQWKLGAT